MTEDLAARLDRIESTLAIQQLPVRYALAVDARDLDQWVSLFVDDVDCGRYGTGRDALKGFIDASLRTFYRSVHFVCGQTIDFIDADHATGMVYSRAEHEDGGKWVVMAVLYADTYERRNGSWYFVKRSERHWYAVDVLDRPGPVDFQKWERWKDRKPDLPGRFPTWQPFWDGGGKEEVTSAP